MAEENRMLIYEMHFSITCSNKTLVQSLLSCQGKKKIKKGRRKQRRDGVLAYLRQNTCFTNNRIVYLLPRYRMPIA